MCVVLDIAKNWKKPGSINQAVPLGPAQFHAGRRRRRGGVHQLGLPAESHAHLMVLAGGMVANRAKGGKKLADSVHTNAMR